MLRIMEYREQQPSTTEKPMAQPLLQAEQERLRAEQRAAEVVVLPLIPLSDPPTDGTTAKTCRWSWMA